MNRFKFRTWNRKTKEMDYGPSIDPDAEQSVLYFYPKKEEIMQRTGLKDKSGVDIFAGDILQFSDKRERHRMLGLNKEEVESDHIKYPYERRAVIIPEGYERLLSNEITQYREVIGNVRENPDLLNKD